MGPQHSPLHRTASHVNPHAAPSSPSTSSGGSSNPFNFLRRSSSNSSKLDLTKDNTRSPSPGEPSNSNNNSTAGGSRPSGWIHKLTGQPSNPSRASFDSGAPGMAYTSSTSSAGSSS